MRIIKEAEVQNVNIYVYVLQRTKNLVFNVSQRFYDVESIKAIIVRKNKKKKSHRSSI